MSDEWVHAPWAIILVHHKVRFQNDLRTRGDYPTKRTSLGVGPIQYSSNLIERTTDVIIRRRFGILRYTYVNGRHARIKKRLLHSLRHTSFTIDRTSLITGFHLLAIVRGIASTITTRTSIPGKFAPTSSTIRFLFSSEKPFLGTISR